MLSVALISPSDDGSYVTSIIASVEAILLDLST